MKTIDSLSKDELSLLLYMESRSVDHGGKLRSEQMNDIDRENAARWNAEGFIRYGRIAREHVSEYGAYWCHLSDEAWALAHEARKVRGARQWANRNYITTEEKRAA